MGALIGAVGGPILGGIIGSIAGGSDRAAAQQASQQALAQIQAVGASPDLAQQIVLQQFKQAGILTPQLEQNINQQFSQVIGNDPTLRNAQLGALTQLQGQANTGLNAADQAALQQIQNNANAAAQGKAQQIQQQYQSMGEGGSGAQLAGELAAGQGGAQQQSAAGLQQAGLQSQRALEALTASGQLAGQVRSADTATTQANIANQNAINQFNTANALGIQQANTNAQNQAQAANLANAQNLSNINTQAANQEQQRELQAQQQMFQNNLGLAQAKANALNQQASNLNQLGQQTAQGWTNVGTGVGQGFGAYANSQANNGLAGAYNNNNQGNNSNANNNFGYGNSSGFGGGAAAGAAGGASQGFFKGGQIVPGVYDFNDEIKHYFKGGQIVPGVYDFNDEIKHYSEGGKVSMQERHKLANQELAEKEPHSEAIAHALLQRFALGGQALPGLPVSPSPLGPSPMNPSVGQVPNQSPLVNQLAQQPGVRNPAALAASIGKNKFGMAKQNRMKHMAHGGQIGDLVGCGMCSGGMSGYSDGGMPGDGHAGDRESIHPNGGYAMGGASGMSEGGNVLDANARKHIAPKNFALAGKRYPIEDIEHARNALARVSQHGSPEEKSKVRSKVHSKYPSIQMGMADGGNVPTTQPNQPMNNSGEIHQNGGGYTGGFWGGRDYKAGGPVDGKAKVKGDSPKNDTVKAMLSPGEIVLPRSVAQDPNAPDKAREFVQITLLMKKHKKGSKEEK
jgi:hypothetical protein